MSDPLEGLRRCCNAAKQLDASTRRLSEAEGLLRRWAATTRSLERLDLKTETRAFLGPPAPALDPACVKCIACRECVGACDCTGGPQTEHECTCYELTGGHQPGCYYNRPPSPVEPPPVCASCGRLDPTYACCTCGAVFCRPCARGTCQKCRSLHPEVPYGT